MPDVFFYVAPDSEHLFGDLDFDFIAQAVAKAVAKVLDLKEEEVVVLDIPVRRAYNANPLQVVCVASADKDRLAKIGELRDAIANALKALAKKRDSNFLNMVRVVESWPLMPAGTWTAVRLDE